MAMTHGELIEAFGGPVALSEILNVASTTPYKWIWRGIPAAYYRRILRAAEARSIKVTLDELDAAAPQYPLKRGPGGVRPSRKGPRVALPAPPKGASHASAKKKPAPRPAQTPAGGR